MVQVLTLIMMNTETRSYPLQGEKMVPHPSWTGPFSEGRRGAAMGKFTKKERYDYILSLLHIYHELLKRRDDYKEDEV